ncbi:uncharacterized protein LOC106868416 isoform X2 [Octopus bimaculoides]|uniref:uncharacterized protein LOC106868416 isoform X2 n=1 Tax=Octopus bimaculoides TaxID=37653 RepID=UPI00071DD2D8|nr:uncharacterized protein LOC106868416 isoform X2 [Octopus bimaculoides]|eukprot:XP_014769147.1 PREDICTED: uncharacterized protein LOC106868416 isoform X2 [Octopus bimaculoides]
MKLIVFETVLFGVLLRLLPVMSLICPVNIGSTLPPLTRIADVICEGTIKKAPSNVKVNSLNVNSYGTGQDNITITVRRVLKGKKKVTSRSELLVNLPKSNQQDACIYTLRKGDKRLFFLIAYKDTYYTMITPPIDSTKIHNRKLRRIISNSDKASNTKRIKKVVKGTKVKLVCTSPIENENAKFRWLRNGTLIRNSRDISKRKKKFKKKKTKKVYQRSTLRIRKVTSAHTGTYTCAIDIRGKKYLKDFFLIVTQPSEKQCEDQHYCLNKGECWYRLPPLDEKYCKCHIDYTGERCETMLGDTVQDVRGQCHYLTSAVIAIGTLLAIFTLILSIALIYFLCKCFKNNRRKSNLPSEYGSFIQASSKGETYCHIPSDDFTQPDLYLSSLRKTTDECYTNNIQESTFSEVPSVSYNERCIPNGNTKLMQSFSSNKLPKERVNDTQNGVLKLPKRHRLSAVSSATQLTDKETLSNGLDIALPETQVIYAEPNHSQPNLPVEGCNHNLNKNLPCDSHLKCDGPLETDTFNNDEHSSTSMLSSSNHSSSDSEDSYNIKLHISEEDLIVKDPAEQKPSSSGKISPKVMYSHSKVPKPDHYSIPVSERQIENPLPNKSSTQNGQALIPAVGKSASQLLINGFQTSVDSCGGEVTRDKSLPNFAF